MADSSLRDPMPDLQIPQNNVREYRDAYIGLVGFVPPRIQARTDLLARRPRPPGIARTNQPLLHVRDAAKLHTLGAHCAGASFEELSAVNYGVEILPSIAQEAKKS